MIVQSVSGDPHRLHVRAIRGHMFRLLSRLLWRVSGIDIDLGAASVAIVVLAVNASPNKMSRISNNVFILNS